MRLRGDRSMEEEWIPKITLFCCNWCSYAGSDDAGVGRKQQPPTTRTIRVMCSGRTDPAFVLAALLEGSDAVLFTGCHIGDCHYISGNYKAKKKFEMLKEVVDELGLEDERLQLQWISASEGSEFAAYINKVTEEIEAIGPSPLRQEWMK